MFYCLRLYNRICVVLILTPKGYFKPLGVFFDKKSIGITRLHF